MITNEVPLTKLQAHISLPRHIRKGVTIKRVIASDLGTAAGCQQLCKKDRECQRTIMFKRNYSFLRHYLLLCHYVMFQKRILNKPK